MEHVAEARMPRWMRVVAAVLAVLFGLMALWMLGLVEEAGTEALVGALVGATVAIRLAVGAFRGSWKWTWSPARMWRV